MATIKEKKINSNTSVYHDALTNDPIAVVKKVDNRYGNSSEYHATWHPDFRSMYPETNDLKYMNVASVGDSKKEIESDIERSYEMFVDVPTMQRDPLHAVPAGVIEKEVSIGGEGRVEKNKYMTWALHTRDKGKHIANLYVKHDLVHHIGVSSKPFAANSYSNPRLRAHVEFVGETPTDEQLLIAKKAHPGHTPINLMDQVKHWHDNKNKVPSFIGVSSVGSNLKIYKTHLEPEKASDAYMEHLQKLPEYAVHSFTRHSPTLFTAYKHPVGEYDIGYHETVDTSTPTKLVHTKVITRHPKHYDTNALQEVIQ